MHDYVVTPLHHAESASSLKSNKLLVRSVFNIKETFIGYACGEAGAPIIHCARRLQIAYTFIRIEFDATAIDEVLTFGHAFFGDLALYRLVGESWRRVPKG